MPTDAPIYDRSFLPVAQFEFVVLGDTHFILDPEPYAVEFDSVRAWPQRGRGGVSPHWMLTSSFIWAI